MLSKHISKGIRNFLIPNPLCLQTEQRPVIGRCFLLITIYVPSASCSQGKGKDVKKRL